MRRVRPTESCPIGNSHMRTSVARRWKSRIPSWVRELEGDELVHPRGLRSHATIRCKAPGIAKTSAVANPKIGQTEEALETQETSPVGAENNNLQTLVTSPEGERQEVLETPVQSLGGAKKGNHAPETLVTSPKGEDPSAPMTQVTSPWEQAITNPELADPGEFNPRVRRVETQSRKQATHSSLDKQSIRREEKTHRTTINLLKGPRLTPSRSLRRELEIQWMPISHWKWPRLTPNLSLRRELEFQRGTFIHWLRLQW